jgi:hypothetical protein
MMNITRVTRGCVAILPLILSACGGSGDQPPLGQVAGKVTLDGQPLKNVELTFAPDSGRPSFGQTDSEGMYDLTYVRNVKGAKIGRHKIMVSSSKVDNSRLEPVEVKAGRNVINIECKPKSSGTVTEEEP